MNKPLIKTYWLLAFTVGWMTVRAEAAQQADIHVAVYSSGFVVDTERRMILGDTARHVTIKNSAKGTAKGEKPDVLIAIDRVDKGMRWVLDPGAKTYSESPYLTSFEEEKGAETTPSSSQQPTLKITRIDPTISGPLGSASINGFPCQSYTIRIVAEFSDPKTNKVVAVETLLEKLWVTEKAPAIERFRKAQSNFNDALNAVHGTQTADFRWLLREFNKHILEMNGNSDDFRSLQTTYQGARAGIKGVTVRQLAGWNWRPKDAEGPIGSSGEDMSALIASIAAGLGAPPDPEGKAALSDSDKPRWVVELEKDLGRTGPTAMMLEEILLARSVTATAGLFEVPETYRKQ